ncbi:MAG: EpsI family protein [Thermoguttaceae bacterium]|nr:EpsI family protein [Thermoguttaceae bacterium]
MTTTVRLLIAAALLVVMQTGVAMIHRAYVPAEVVIPEQPLSSLPMQLGDWTGESIELDERLFNAIGAHTVVNRVYRNPAGQQVSVHLALIADPTANPSHYPEVCYPSSGWGVVDRETSKIEAPGAAPVSARRMVYEQDRQQVQILFWYQLGDRSFVDRDSYRNARQAYFGRREWPPAIKVLLQVPSANRNKAQLEDVASKIRAWLAGFGQNARS